MTPKDLLAAVRTAQGIPSNYRLARVLDVPDKTVQRWQVGANAPDAAMGERLAKMAGLDPDVVVAAMQAFRERDPIERARWERIAERLRAVAACCLAAILSGFISGGPDAHARAPIEASAVAPTNGASLTDIYIVRTFQRLARWCLARLTSPALWMQPAQV